MRSSSRQIKWMFKLVSFLFAGALFIASIRPSWAQAQSSIDPWVEPLNLSRSGSALNPSFVIDSEGVRHVLWQDELANFLYTRFDGEQWSTPRMTDLDRLFVLPIPTDLPDRNRTELYTGSNPLFIAAPGSYTYAFWITPQGRLFTSRVRNENFGLFKSWQTGSVIAHEAASFAVAIDARGEWHLAYIRTIEDSVQPAGIYYTHSRNGGNSWAVARLLYESPYFRRLTEGEANISLATDGTEDSLGVYIAWDNRPRKQLFLAQSTDGGETWEQPALVAGPAPGSGTDGPFNIQVGTYQKSVVLVWQNGRTTNGLLPGCSQLYQSSSDAGTTWTEPQTMIDDLLGCAQSNEFITKPLNKSDGLLYFLTKTKSQNFLVAWNGLQWSEPEAQPILSGFEEPEIYTDVLYGCQRSALWEQKLYIVGCDEGQGGDIWVTSRDLGSNTSWFQPPAWSPLSSVISDTPKMEAVELVATDDGLIHAFFSQHLEPTIYYTYWNGELWSRTTPVLELPEGQTAWPVIATGSENDLFLIARSDVGTLYFSRAASGDAATASRWSPPTRLEISSDAEIGSVDVARDASETVYVVYSVPVNEARGIYLVQSEDNGASWSEPLRVFDGAAAGFDLVGAPSLLASENGFLHIIWNQQSIQGDGIPQSLSLYYTRSEDGGKTFTEAEPVVERSVAWREIVTDGEGYLHLLWQPQDTPTTIWDQVSFDGGHSWQVPQGMPDQGVNAAVMADSVGQLHVVNAGPGYLGHWRWDGSRWQPEEPLHWTLASQQDISVDLFAAAVNKKGKMVVALAVPASDGGVAERTLLYSIHTLDFPPKQAATQKAPTPTVLPPTLTVATITPEPSSTPPGATELEPTNSQGQTGSDEPGAGISPLVMALFPVALLLLSVLGVAIRRATKAKER